MVYKIKEKVWSIRDTFAITDEQGNTVYTVKGKLISLGKKLTMKNAEGHEVAAIHQKIASLKPRYTLYREGKELGKVVKHWNWLKKRFTLEIPGTDICTIRGSFYDHEFTFTRAGQPVATVSKRLFSWGDSYGVNIVEGEDDLAILCTCIVIDQVMFDGKDK